MYRSVEVLIPLLVVFGASGTILRGVRDSRVDENEILRKFFEATVRSLESSIWKPSHATILGKEARDFESAAIFLEHYPGFIGEELSTFISSKEFSVRALIFSFLPNLRNETMILERMQSSSKCSSCRLFFIAREILSEEQISTIIHGGTTVSEFVRIIRVRGSGTVEIYGRVMSNECKPEAELTIEWKPGAEVASSIIFNAIIRDFKKCEIRVFAKGHMPMMGLTTRDGKKVITAGIEGLFVLIMARLINMTPKVITLGDQRNETRSHQLQIIDSIEKGEADVGIGHLILTPNFNKRNISFTFNSLTDHLVWCVPLVTTSRFNTLTDEFSWTIWIGLFVVIVAFVGLVRAFQRASTIFRDRSPRGVGPRPSLRRISMGRGDEIRTKTKGWISTALDAFSMCLGNPVVFDPIYDSTKILVVTFLFYATVLTTAYKSSLSSMVTTGNDRPAIVDVQGIIDANLTTGGTRTYFDLLVDQINATAENPELVRRFVVLDQIDEVVDRLQTRKDFACLIPKTIIDYRRMQLESQNDVVNFYVLPEIVTTMNMIVIFQKESLIRRSFFNVQSRLFESGNSQYWTAQSINRAINVTGNDPVPHRTRIGHLFKFERIFFFYLCSLAISCLVFVVEILVRKYAETNHFVSPF